MLATSRIAIIMEDDFILWPRVIFGQGSKLLRQYQSGNSDNYQMQVICSKQIQAQKYLV